MSYYLIEYRNAEDPFFELQHYPPCTSNGVPVTSGLVECGIIYDMYVTKHADMTTARKQIPSTFILSDRGLCFANGVDGLYEVYRHQQ